MPVSSQDWLENGRADPRKEDQELLENTISFHRVAFICTILGQPRIVMAGHHFICFDLTVIVHWEEKTSVTKSTQVVWLLTSE